MNRLRVIRVLCLLFAVFIGLIVYAADTGVGDVIFDRVRALPYGDKISHFCLMGTLSLLANLACRCRGITTRARFPGLGTTLVAAIVLAEEISQIWIPNRSFDYFDLLADALGIASGEIIARLAQHRLQ